MYIEPVTSARTGAARAPRGQGELLRERLVDAAMALLDEQGEMSRISIRAVTRGAGVSPTAFYLHFDTREELILACVERSFTQFRDHLRAIAAESKGPWDQLIRAGLAYMRFARERPARYRLIFGFPTRDPEATGMDPANKPEAGGDAFDDLVALVLANLAADDPRREDPATVARCMWSGLHGYVTLRQSRPGMDWPADEEFAQRLGRAWLGGPAG